MRWNTAEKWLYRTKREYEGSGVAGFFAITMTINPLVQRYESGERTKELYDEIMELE